MITCKFSVSLAYSLIYIIYKVRCNLIKWLSNVTRKPNWRAKSQSYKRKSIPMGPKRF